MKEFFKSITKFEAALWVFSAAAIVLSSVFFGRADITSVCASLVGISALILVAKGNYRGQALMILFSVMYGIISIRQKYYGEAITYLGMAAPASLVTMIAWIRNPYKDSGAVRVSSLTPKKLALIIVLTAAVTALFYFILGAMGNAQLEVSTLSVATSFLAASLMFFRSPYYALAYAANDIVLIILWTLAALVSPAHIPVAVCFFTFLFNDIYGFYSWTKMKKSQSCETSD